VIIRADSKLDLSGYADIPLNSGVSLVGERGPLVRPPGEPAAALYRTPRETATTTMDSSIARAATYGWRACTSEAR
jgi:hypothetical protein